jgi:hypothetical protein
LLPLRMWKSRRWATPALLGAVSSVPCSVSPDTLAARAERPKAFPVSRAYGWETGNGCPADLEGQSGPSIAGHANRCFAEASPG